MNKIFAVTLSLTFLLFFTGYVFAQDTATESSDAIREKVQEKVNQALNSPRFYMGTITDISETTIQISRFVFDSNKEKSGEIQQISINKDSSFVNAKDTAKIIKLTDVAIGDFIVAMGYKNGNSVLEASRILIIEALKPSNRTSVYATVVGVGKNELEVKLAGKEETLLISPSKGMKITTLTDGKSDTLTFSEIEENQIIIAVGELNDNELTARKIHVVSQTPTTPSSSPTASPKTSPTPKTTPKPTPSE